MKNLEAYQSKTQVNKEKFEGPPDKPKAQNRPGEAKAIAFLGSLVNSACDTAFKVGETATALVNIVTEGS